MTTINESLYPFERYPIRLYFTRLFVRGSLKGMRHDDALPFVSMESCQAWLKGIKANSKAKKLEWELADYAFQSYFR